MFRNMFLRSAYGYDADQASLDSGLSCRGPSLAVQSQRDEADINVIVKRFNITGKLPDNVRAPTYVDFDGIFDFQSAQNAVIAAKDSFMQMPAKVRGRFQNNADLFVDFCSDPANIDEAVKLGLAIPREVITAGERDGKDSSKPAGKVGGEKADE